jgi:hypothetical protein
MISNLTVGTYSVTVRDTNDCTINTSIVITEPSPIFFTSLGFTDESCLGACDGEIEVDVTGGVPPYTPIATNQIGSLSTSVMIDSSNILGVCSGTYVLSFTDENSCPSTLINGGVSTQAISPSVVTQADVNTVSNVLCYGYATGSLEVLGPNTDPAYTYSWQDLNGNVVDTTVNATNLLAGTYVLYAGYNNTPECTTTDTAIVTEGSPITFSSVVTDLLCNGDSNVSINISQIIGGTFPYTYSWNTGVTTQNINNLIADIYTLTITDSNGCQQIDSFEVTEPQALIVTVSSTNYVLTVDLTTGGTPSYTYQWNDGNGVIPGATSSTYIVVNYGTYYVQVTDAEGCEGMSSSFTFTATGQIDLLSSMQLDIYPNPFNKETTVDFGTEVKEASIRIVDMFGKLIEKHEIKDQDKYIIKRGNKASGVYFLEIEINQEYLNNFKLVIE